jgi:hypothetical protein
MLDLGFEGWREKRRERERNRWVREKKKRRRRSLGQSWLRSFILVFTNRITDEILNINMLLVILFVKSNWYLGPFYQKKSQMKN